MAVMYTIDNSALSNVLNGDDYFEAFKKLNIHIIIPKETYIETVGGKYAPKRMLRLSELMSSGNSIQVDLTESLSFLLKYESSLGGIADGIPILDSCSKSDFIKTISNAGTFAEFHAKYLLEKSRSFQVAKEEIKKIESSQKRISIKQNEEIVRSIICNYKGVQSEGDFFQEFCGLIGEMAPGWEIETFWKNKHSHYLKTYINLLHLRTLGNLLEISSRDDELLFLKKRKEGNWHDLHLIALGSKHMNLISSDRDQIGMHKFMQKMGLIESSVISPEELLHKVNEKESF